MSKKDNSWSTLTLREIDQHIDRLKERIPVLESVLDVRIAFGSMPGADVELTFKHASGARHYLLLEVEQYASGDTVENKVRAWGRRHILRENTTTVVVSLVLQALRNRLINAFSKHDEVREMVFSNNFRLFPGRGDGGIPEELKLFIATWVEDKLMSKV